LDASLKAFAERRLEEAFPYLIWMRATSGCAKAA
jgi:hypothetical protein